MIEFVRRFEYYGTLWTDVKYKSGRVVSYRGNLPETVKKFIASATKIYLIYDEIFGRDEMIYENGGNYERV